MRLEFSLYICQHGSRTLGVGVGHFVVLAGRDIQVQRDC